MDSASQVFDTLVTGQKARRAAAQALATAPESGVDRGRLRLLIIDGLSREFAPGRETTDGNPEIGAGRCWLLGTLGRVAEADAKAMEVLESHTDPKFEPNRWARFWAVEGLIAAGRVPSKTMETIAKRMLARDPDLLVRSLGTVWLAAHGDAVAAKYVMAALDGEEVDADDSDGSRGGDANDTDEDPTEIDGEQSNADPDEAKWAVLRALQVVPIPATVGRICAIAESEGYSDSGYEALVALGHVPAAWTHHAGRASESLTKAVKWARRYPGLDGMRATALEAIGRIGVGETAPLLVDQLEDDNPAVVRAAARALAQILGVRTAVARVVEAAARRETTSAQSFATALRFIDRTAVVEELEASLTNGSIEAQDAARALLVDVGGAEAMQKLRSRATALTQYNAALNRAETTIQGLFESSIKDARGGFHIATWMDMTVFVVGVVLLVASGVRALAADESLNSWAVGTTAAGGVLGVLYGTLIANPRRQVRESVDHLMKLKVVFLAYLRQLHQVDQIFTRRLMDDRTPDIGEIDDYSRMVRDAMKSAAEQVSERSVSGAATKRPAAPGG